MLLINIEFIFQNTLKEFTSNYKLKKSNLKKKLKDADKPIRRIKDENVLEIKNLDISINSYYKFIYIFCPETYGYVIYYPITTKLRFYNIYYKKILKK